MAQYTTRLVTSVAVLALVPCLAAAESVKVPSTIEFAAAAKISEPVKQQCNIQTDIPRYIDAYSDQVEVVDGPVPTRGRVLNITITDARSRGGGIYSGSKWVTVEGVLTDNGRTIGNFSGRRATIGYFNLFRRCGPARRCSKALGKDIAAWLENPEKDSTLNSP